jgi:hypothetical protein
MPSAHSMQWKLHMVSVHYMIGKSAVQRTLCTTALSECALAAVVQSLIQDTLLQ